MTPPDDTTPDVPSSDPTPPSTPLLDAAGVTGSHPAGEATSPWEVARPSKARDHSHLKTGIVAAVVGGLVGALAAGGVFAVVDEADTITQVIRPTDPAVVERPSTEIAGDLDVAAIIEKAEPAIVAITTGDGPGSGNGGAGTGFVITADGYTVTNNHVVEGAESIEVAFTNGETRAAEIVGRDPSVDLAVLKVDGTGLPTVELGDSDAVQVGDEVVAIGNALALEGGLSVTRGIISGTDRTVETENAALVGMLQTDAAIKPGNSGGPLLDSSGRVIGIDTAVADPGSAQNVGFAIPISRAQPIVEDLRAGRKPAFLGVSTQDVTAAAARELDLQVEDGAYVTSVTADAPAGKAGIEVGDVVVEIDGQTIGGPADVQTAVRSNRPGDEISVVVDRKGERKTFQVTLVERPDVQ